MASESIEYLIPKLRLHLGDTDADTYRYMDEWLIVALVASIESLQRWWSSKYLLTVDDEVYRNTSVSFDFDEPPIIQTSDVRAVILMASIIIKKGSLQNMSWSVGNWRDAEIQYSNIEGGREREASLKDDWNELKSIITPPTRKLAPNVKMHLPGYKYGIFEYD